MARKKDQAEDRIVAVEEALTRTERFIEENQRILGIVIGAIIIIVLGYFAFQRFYLAPKEKEAQAQMFMAERYFESDSLDLALNGDGNFPGFLEIIDDYGMTKSANLAHYYTGLIYLKKGDFEESLRYLKGFSSKDVLVSAMAISVMGDCHMELGDTENAIKSYLKAADRNPNDMTTPTFLLKAGWAYEVSGQYAKAADVYERIKKEHPLSQESRDIEKYIVRARQMAKTS